MSYTIIKSFDWSRGAWPIFEAVKNKDYVFFLDSSKRNIITGRYSFLGHSPFYVYKADRKPGVFKQIRGLLNQYSLQRNNFPFPFIGGAVGYFSYELGAASEKVRTKPADETDCPDIYLALYDAVMVIDHFTRKLHIIASSVNEKNRLLAKKKAQTKIREYCRGLLEIPPREKIKEAALTGLESNYTKERYIQAVKKAKAYIKEGDIYQVNLSQRFSARTSRDGCAIYKKLRVLSPSNFSAYLDCGEFQVLSSSPERFLVYDGKKVLTLPMKGTRARSDNKIQDERLKKDLLESPKDKAELLMIVDLLRNDLGKVCEYGSIKVNNMRRIEAYETVYQATSTIEGLLYPDKDRIDLLRACLPGGSITGCPKIRAMQIIEELEPVKRGIYTGVLGYLSFHNTMDMNILIRTLLKKKDKVYFQTGSGIVADSLPQAEYEETLVKARGILSALGA